jgi:hypothetical protein
MDLAGLSSFWLAFERLESPMLLTEWPFLGGNKQYSSPALHMADPLNLGLAY